MSLYETFTDAGAALIDGVWIDYGDARVKIRYAGKANKKYVKTLRALTAPYTRLLENEDANIDDRTQKKIDALLAEVYAKSILADWENVQDRTGSELEFSWENAKMILLDLDLFFDEVKKVAGSMKHFRQKMLEEEAKNL
jgi:hypothetical protein